MSCLNQFIINYNLIHEFDIELLKENQFVPLCKDDFLITVAVTLQSDLEPLKRKYHLPIKEVFVPLHEIHFLLQEASLKQTIYDNAIASIQQESSTSFIDGFLESLIHFSIQKNSSDIHIEAHENSVSIRFRIDGILQQFFRFKQEFYGVLSSVIKLLSSMDITQRRKPQNGRFSKIIAGYSYDFRVSIMPTINGESIVIRILDTQSVKKELDGLGFQPKVLSQIKRLMHLPQGLILVTGPTGSGKTTTLYSILEEINTVHKKIITIEDPVEYSIANIQQVAVNTDIELGFAEILKDVLRQDPDILMIGEIRDKLSLKIAIQASLTGHLVLATLHANDSLSTLNRLLDLGAPRYLIASTLKAVIAQRLALKLCEKCKKEVILTTQKVYEAGSCEECNLTGYKHRLMFNEILEVDEHMASMIAQNHPLADIETHAKQKGFERVYDNGMQQVQEGLTSLEELYKVTGF